MRIIKINTTPSYDVLVQQGLLSNVGQLVNKIKSYDKIAIITDDVVQKLYLQSVMDSFKGFSNQICTYVFANGESSKNLIELAKIYDFLADNQITRTDLIIALGGGVCGDMVGYAASSYLRGVDFVNIPTTLLSMVDSSVGGKTAVNIPAGKNQVGSFYQPKLVICDTNTLKSLSEELIADGVGEIAKYAVLEDKGLFDLLLSGEFFENIEDIIETCVKIKDEYVSADVFDKGKRQLLNLGHTLGHVIEKESKFSLAHGKAVLIGLYYIAQKFAGSRDIKKILETLEQVAKKYNMPITYNLTADELWKMAGNDKKRHGDFVTIARPYAIGDCRLENVKIGNPINFTEKIFDKAFDVEITPKQLSGIIDPPPSKSHLHRLLIMSAFCGAMTEVKNVTFSNDILATLKALGSLGAKFKINKNSVQFNGLFYESSAKIDCGESGSTLRFFIPICSMLGVSTQFVGSKRLGERGYADIIEACESGKVAKYVTDFPTEATINQPGIITIPHLGASTEESEDNCAVMAAHELIDYLENGNITNSVNYPAISMPRSGLARLVVLHKNQPEMLSSITAVLASDGVNIDNMTSRSKGDYACALLDCVGTVTPAHAADIAAIDGVIRVLIK